MSPVVQPVAQTIAVSFFAVSCIILLAGFLVGTVVEAIVALTE